MVGGRTLMMRVEEDLNGNCGRKLGYIISEEREPRLTTKKGVLLYGYLGFLRVPPVLVIVQKVGVGFER
ncbi:hypothetical protein GOBAR_AA23734 [Gossypium barbadense]|uniref:Uncharacterized protein n=1 Tax=Gossypium barbadense TaxID=3634 RepID=A0A2P5X0R3_GOSBA|nr:hypothetical protein GOBAR_AA23734 [Gossypium barbadense]